MRRPYISIAHSMWWAIVAVTTIGYGDLIPTTACGRTVASALLIADIVLLALPSKCLSRLLLRSLTAPLFAAIHALLSQSQ